MTISVIEVAPADERKFFFRQGARQATCSSLPMEKTGVTAQKASFRMTPICVFTVSQSQVGDVIHELGLCAVDVVDGVVRRVFGDGAIKILHIEILIIFSFFIFFFSFFFNSAGDMEMLAYFFGPIGILLCVNVLLFLSTARQLTCGLWKRDDVKSTTER